MEYRKAEELGGIWNSTMAESRAEFYEKRKKWEAVTIPHNWEDYQGYHQVSHGNLHGTAWYEKRFTINLAEQEAERWYICFEGVGSYASVWMNDLFLGKHSGGRTCFTLDMTEALREGENVLLVKTEHPEKIDDLPWVCGGCYGTPNTEGSQPLGIFRPVWIYHTKSVRIMPFGVYVETKEVSEENAFICIETELSNEGNMEELISISSVISDPSGEKVGEVREKFRIGAGELVVKRQRLHLKNPMLWSLKSPYLYKVSSYVMREDGTVSDSTENSFGIRTIEWENFEAVRKTILDYEKLTEKPDDRNLYFVQKKEENQNALAEIASGGVRIREEWQEDGSVILYIATKVINRSKDRQTLSLESFVQTYNRTKSIASLADTFVLQQGEEMVVEQRTDALWSPDLWNLEYPVLHRVVTTLRDGEDALSILDRAETSFGISGKDGLANKGYPYKEPEKDAALIKSRFLLNGEPVFINGTCEYEHMLGNDHAFDNCQIEARIGQIKAAGFNAFREAHCPHNLRYLELCEKMGILYWPQMGAHLYCDNDRFRENFRNLTKEWVRERRNSPSVILWGIQNESLLPAAFTEEIKELIGSLDSSVPTQRKTSTCNGGFGSDWDIPQNWSGTYGGSVEEYDRDIVRQRLVGEYGQYRVIGLHEEGDMEGRQNGGGHVSEELFAYCLRRKAELGEKMKDYSYGHFQWIFSSHANPGRELIYCIDGKGIDGVGVINNKGLLTSWGEPVDAYYMYRAKYVSAADEPMVYLVSHTWPSRFSETGQCADITVYSNCEEVELLNGVDGNSLGRCKTGQHRGYFVFEKVLVKYNVFTARGFVEGKQVAEDRILLNNLPEAPDYEQLYDNAEEIVAEKNGEYLYRVNCAGTDYQDRQGNWWKKDRPFDGNGYGFRSWAMAYENVSDELGSERRVDAPIRNTKDQGLMETFRYGRKKLSYHFCVEPGDYVLELYFMEPWYGIGGGMDCKNWRVFDVAVNGRTVLKNLDIWSEAGTLRMLKKEIAVRSVDKEICISFPEVKSGQAVISAIAVRKL